MLLYTVYLSSKSNSFSKVAAGIGKKFTSCSRDSESKRFLAAFETSHCPPALGTVLFEINPAGFNLNGLNTAYVNAYLVIGF